MAQININTVNTNTDTNDNAGVTMEIIKDNDLERVEKFESDKIKNKIYVKCIVCQKQGYRLEDYSKYKSVGLIDFWNIHPYTIKTTNKLTGKVKLEQVNERCYLGEGRLLDDMIDDSRKMENRQRGRKREIEKAIPSVSELLTPLLKLLADQKEHSLDEVKDRLAKTYQLSERDRTKIFQNRPRRVFDTRVIHAVSHLRKEGLLENKERAIFKITKSGINKLK